MIATAAANSATYTWTGATVGTTYSFRVAAVNAVAESAPTNTATVTTPSPPAAPSNLVATAAANGTQVNLTWTDNATTETGFKVYVSLDGATWSLLTTPAANVAAYTWTTAIPGTAYSFRVTAVNAAGESAASNIATATTPSATAPRVASFRVNDGSAQRSMVKSLTVTFSMQVTLGSGAFVLTLQGGGPAVSLTFTTTVTGGVTMATINFPRGVGGSLADGRYVLTTVAAQVHNGSGAAMVTDRQDAFFRLFGDVNGDGAVNGYDQNVFRGALGSTVKDADYLWYLDFNGDGAIDKVDRLAFRNRFGTTLP